MFLGNAYIDKLAGGTLPAFGCPAPYARGASGYGAHLWVLVHDVEEGEGREVVVVVGRGCFFEFASLLYEGGVVVPSLFVGLGGGIAFAFEGVDVHHHGAVGVPDALEGLDEGLNAVALVHVEVVQPHGAEEVAGALAVALAELAEVVIESAMVFGNGHLIVVDDNDEVGTEFGGPVETLEGFATAEGTVAYDGHYVIVAAGEVSTFGQSAGEAYGC